MRMIRIEVTDKINGEIMTISKVITELEFKVSDFHLGDYTIKDLLLMMDIERDKPRHPGVQRNDTIG